MIEDLIRKAAKEYFENISRDEFISDLRKAGFTVYEADQVSKVNVKVSYTISQIDFLRTYFPIKDKPIELNEKMELPAFTYRFPCDLNGNGEFNFGDAA
jgi:hypothetical protein